MSGRHSPGGPPRNRGRRAVRWRPSTTSGEALVAWGTFIIITGGFVTVFTRPLGFGLIGLGALISAYGLTASS